MNDDAPRENPSAFTPPVSSFTGPIAELIAQRMLFPPSRPGLLAILDQFEIQRVLGGGGMGVVLLARDSDTGRDVAIKLVKSDLVTNQNVVHRFLKETGHLKRLRHTNVVPVQAISDRVEGPYFVMPYFEKGSLASRIKPGQPLDTESILDIAAQVAEGLSFAHRSGIIHRDLKPANILLTADGKACLADFGLARTLFNDTMVDVETRHAYDMHDPMLANIDGIAFLATPHGGSGLARILGFFTIFLPTQLALELIAAAPQLRDLGTWYRNHCRQLGIEHVVLYETRRTFLIGKIVAEDRADPGLEGVDNIPADETHDSICKPATKECLVFTGVPEELRKRAGTFCVLLPHGRDE